MTHLLRRQLLTLLWGIGLASGLLSCASDPVPRPEGYFRIDLPQEREFQRKTFHCPFTFELPEDAYLALRKPESENPCWFEIRYPRLKATVFMTYRDVYGSRDTLRALIDEAYGLTLEHQVKASALESANLISDSLGVYGTFYQLEGPVASQVQFYLTDSTDHFLRGSLYFTARPNPDSLQPVVNYLANDLMRLCESFRWQN